MANRKRNSSGRNPGAKLKNTGITFIVVAIVAAIALLYKFFPEYADFIFGEGDLPTSEYVSGTSAEFHFIDVGQGDGMLIRTAEGDIVVDAGPSATEDDFVNYLKERGVTSIEYLVLTHPHGDHIGGADAVLEEFDVKKVLIPNTDCTTSMYMKVLRLMDEENCEVIEARVNEVHSLGDFRMTVLAPNGIGYDGYNNYSVVIRAEFGNTSVLLTGDAEKISENEMITAVPMDLLDCDILKIGHHGSSTSTTKTFLAAVSPEYAVISCGADNEYGHPHKETKKVLQTLEAAGRVYRTDTSGSIVFTTDGNTFTPTTEK